METGRNKGRLKKPSFLVEVAKLSDEFDVEITPLMIVPENFQSAQAMWQMIEKLQDE